MPLWETACAADIGGREEQQDRVGEFAHADAVLLVLADGAGGHEGGALAAQAALDAAAETFAASDHAEPGALLSTIAAAAHERVNVVGGERGVTPHSTLVLLHLSATAAAWAHVGDSRLYRFADGRLAERTLDHSVVELLRLQGRISEAQMKTHPDKNRLTEALGGERAPQVENGGKASAVEDGFLLASDGVWENASNADLQAVFRAANLSAGLRRLVERAKARGGADCDNLAAAAARQRVASSRGVRWLRRWRRP